MITVEYIKGNQHESQHINVMKQMHLHINNLIDAHDWKGINDFLYDFCNSKPQICFQYYVCLLSATLCIEDLLHNREGLKYKAIEIGTEEIGETDTIMTLYGLI